MKINELQNDILYIEEAIPMWREFIEAIENNDNNDKIRPVIPPWQEWFDGNPNPEDFSQWIADPSKMRGYRKAINYDVTLNQYGNIWPRITHKDLDESHQMASPIIDMIDKPLKEVIDLFYSKHDFPKLEYITKNYEIRKYKKEAYMGGHLDINPHLDSMDWSILVYLNDDYTGGEINFTQLGFKIKPSAGSVVIFPCRTEHAGCQIYSGEKYYLPFFVHTPYKMITAFGEPYIGSLDKI